MYTPTETEILAGLREWVEIETPTGHVAGLAQMMDVAGAAYAALGARVERIPGRDGHGDQLSIRMPWTGAGGDEDPCILILSHLDTVHPVGTLRAGLPWRIEGERAYGPGIADMKGGAYIAYRALRSLAEAGEHGPLPVHVLLTSDEEVGSPTSRAMIERAAERAKYVLVTEPARDGGKIVTGRKGVARYVLEAHGRASHSGTAHAAGNSAIAELARQVIAIAGRTDYDRGLTTNVGRIEGGTTVNTIPAYAKAEIDVRIARVTDAEEIDAWLRGLQPADPGVRLELSGGLNRPPFEKTPAIEALLQHARTLAEEIGFELVDMYAGGGSDGSFTAQRVATLDGLGVDGAMVHTHEEHLLIPSLVPRMTLMRRLIETLS